MEKFLVLHSLTIITGFCIVLDQCSEVGGFSSSIILLKPLLLTSSSWEERRVISGHSWCFLYHHQNVVQQMNISNQDKMCKYA